MFVDLGAQTLGKLWMDLAASIYWGRQGLRVRTTIGDRKLNHVTKRHCITAKIPVQHRVKNCNCNPSICGFQGRAAPIITRQEKFPQQCYDVKFLYYLPTIIPPNKKDGM